MLSRSRHLVFQRYLNNAFIAPKRLEQSTSMYTKPSILPISYPNTTQKGRHDLQLHADILNLWSIFARIIPASVVCILDSNTQNEFVKPRICENPKKQEGQSVVDIRISKGF